MSVAFDSWLLGVTLTMTKWAWVKNQHAGNLFGHIQLINYWLVVWNMCYFFTYIGNFIIPTDELHHFSEG